MNRIGMSWKLVLTVSIIGAAVFVALRMWDRGSVGSSAQGPEDQRELRNVTIVSSDNTPIHTIRVEIEEFSPPIVVNYPAETSVSGHISDEVLSAYLASCNPVSMTYDAFVSFTTTAYREKTKRQTRTDFDQEMGSLKRLAADKGMDTSTKSVLLYKVLVSGEFGEICYIVRLPSFLTVNDLHSAREEDYSYTLLTKMDGGWKLESTDMIPELGLEYLDYKDRVLLGKLASSRRAILNLDRTKIERME